MRCRTPKSHISKVENGQGNLSIPMLVLVAEALELPVAVFFEGVSSHRKGR